VCVCVCVCAQSGLTSIGGAGISGSGGGVQRETRTGKLYRRMFSSCGPRQL